jgi:hypothetical protein
MPAADPFDPLDGHEGDVQMIFPSAEACPAQPNIHRDLLEMAEGLVDQRWLLWLDTRGDRAAKALAADLHDKLKGNFAQAASLTRKDMDAVRASIAELARRPKVSQQ